jgi:hypothetical protein
VTRVPRFIISAAFLVAATPVFAIAQQAISTASVTGRVLDPSGAAIVGVEVTIRSVDRNQTQRTVTSDRGRYRFAALPVGAYELSASAPGFTERTLALTLAVGDAIDVPIALDVAGVAASVSVSSAAPTIEARRTQVAEEIAPREIDGLPLNGRNYLDLALLVPGVSRTVQRTTERFAETSAVPGTGISVAGQRNLNNTFIVDGLSANDDAAGLAGTYFGEEVIREFAVVTSGGIAEFGRASAGVINVVTRSGSNARSGRLYGFFRDDAMDAPNPLARREDPLSQVQFGATFSGPLVRDRTFWFGNFEQTRLDRTGIVTVDPSAVTVINNVLDARGYPGPSVATGEFPTGYDTTNLFGRIDHSVSAADRLAIRYSLYDVGSGNARSVGGLSTTSRGTRLDDRDQTVAANWLATGSSASVFELRGQATRSRLAAPPNDAIGPAVSIAGIANFGTSTTSPTGRDLDVYEVSGAYTAQRGDHLLKGGVTAVYERLNVAFPGALQGVYSFPSLASFQLGRYTNFQQAFGEPDQFQENPNLGLFVQDEWRPRGDLTINAGLRYDLQWIHDLVRTDTNNVSPRLGIAYAPGDGRTVLRAAGGLYFDRIPLRAVSNALQRDGRRYRLAVVPFGQDGAPVFPRVLEEFPPTLLTSITSIDPRIQNGVSWQASVQLERQLAGAVSASVGYLHLTGRQIIMSRNLNVPTLTAAEAAAIGDRNLGRPDSTVANNSQYQGSGRSRYDGVILSLDANGGRWGTLRASYTLSKAMDDAGNAFFSSPQDNADVHADWGRSDNDQRHRVTVSGTAPTLAGVQLAFLFSYASAPPFNIQTGTDRNGDTNANDRPVGVGRNTGLGFDAATLDLRLSRAFTIARRGQVEVMLDAFNVLNRANYLIPNNTWGPGATPRPGFGDATAAGDARQLQVGARWTF